MLAGDLHGTGARVRAHSQGGAQVGAADQGGEEAGVERVARPTGSTGAAARTAGTSTVTVPSEATAPSGPRLSTTVRAPAARAAAITASGAT